MRLGVLGPLEIVGRDRRERLGSGSQRTILGVLIALRSEVVSPDALTEALWGAWPPASARKSLHSHVSRLRRALAALDPDGGELVTSVPGGYHLELGDHELDADQFEALVAAAQQVLDEAPRQAADRLDEALGLWRGTAFGELAACDPVRPEAVRLNQLRAAAVADWVAARLALGDHRAVISPLEAAVADDPLAEGPHGQLMLALYRSGRQVDALAVFRRLQQRLGDELGSIPPPRCARYTSGSCVTTPSWQPLGLSRLQTVVLAPPLLPSTWGLCRLPLSPATSRSSGSSDETRTCGASLRSWSQVRS